MVQRRSPGEKALTRQQAAALTTRPATTRRTNPRHSSGNLRGSAKPSERLELLAHVPARLTNPPEAG